MENLKPCPFCGHWPIAEPWHGGGPRKTMIHCINNQCAISPSACENTFRKAAKAWNRRYPMEHDAVKTTERKEQ